MRMASLLVLTAALAAAPSAARAQSAPLADVESGYGELRFAFPFGRV
jgi:hypothetical protein